MVVIGIPSAADTGRVQVRTARPSRCTVQAPQAAMPHPNLVPVKPSVSRSTHSSGVSGSTSTVRVCPFTVSVIAMTTSPSRDAIVESYRIVGGTSAAPTPARP